MTILGLLIRTTCVALICWVAANGPYDDDPPVWKHCVWVIASFYWLVIEIIVWDLKHETRK